MGDDGMLYVTPEMVTLYREAALPCADVIFPNQTEAEYDMWYLSYVSSSPRSVLTRASFWQVPLRSAHHHRSWCPTSSGTTSSSGPAHCHHHDSTEWQRDNTEWRPHDTRGHWPRTLEIDASQVSWRVHWHGGSLCSSCPRRAITWWSLARGSTSRGFSGWCRAVAHSFEQRTSSHLRSTTRHYCTTHRSPHADLTSFNVINSCTIFGNKHLVQFNIFCQ